MIHGAPHTNGHSTRTDLVHAHHLSMAHAHNATEQSPLAMIDDRMRGRWKFAIPLGIALGLGLAYLGYTQAPVTYVSTGNIHVVPSGSPIMHTTPESSNLPRYEGVITTQSIFVRQPRVIDHALQNDEQLAALPLAKLPDAREVIAGNLTSGVARGAELISVSYEAASPAVAQTVVNSILRSYEEIHGRGVGDQRNRRYESLLENQRNSRAELNRRKQELLEFVARTQSGALITEDLLHVKLLERENLQTDILRREFELSIAQAKQSQGGEEVQTTVVEPTTAELDAIDPVLSSIRTELQRLGLERQQWADRRNNSNHPVMQQYDRQIDVLQVRLDQQQRVAREAWMLRKNGSLAANSLATGSLRSVEEISTELSLLKSISGRLEKDLKNVTDEYQQAQLLKHDIDKLTQELSEIEVQIRVHQVESDAIFAGSISIAEWGSRPLRPAKDRRLQMAGVGFAGGIGVSLALFFLIGSFDQRTYSTSQLHRSRHKYRCLGVLPDLGIGRLNREMSETAVHCIHQIRNRIEALRDPTPTFMVAVSSPFQGDGKTSLCLSLGWSYAAAGYRTLLMDCDIVGRGLSYQLGLSHNEGVREVLRDRHLGSQIVKLPVANLNALPAGVDRRVGPESIRRDDFGTLGAELRQMFDVIIIDTGPFIGSVELLPVASAADSLLFSIRRGRSRARLDECVNDLAASGIPCLGVVLNCATHGDCTRYVSKSLTSRVAAIVTPDNAAPPRDENALVRAMQHMEQEQVVGQESRR
jgi:polysaccharide biosynthesis transport protein